IPGKRRQSRCDEIDRYRDEEQFLSPQPVGAVAEKQRAEHCAGEVKGRAGADLRIGEPSVSRRVRIPPNEPASVTSRPSRIQVAPSETTISQCHRLHGIRSSRAGTYDSIVSPSAMLKCSIVALRGYPAAAACVPAL